MNHQPKPVDEKKNYHDELVRMAEERQHLKQLEKLKERQESNAVCDAQILIVQYEFCFFFLNSINPLRVGAYSSVSSDWCLPA